MNESERAEWRAEHQRALDFFAQVKPSDTVKIERYACVSSHPYCLDKYADIHEKKTVKIYAMNKNGLWFTTYAGQAIDADTLLKWEIIPQQMELEL